MGRHGGRRRLKALVALLIVLAAAGWDQATKSLARARLEGRPPVTLVDRIVVLSYVENEGAFLSLGAQLPRPARMAAFIAFPVIILVWMIVFLVRRQGIGWGALAGFSLIVGGGAGNLFDRLVRDGRVGDFIMVGIGGIHSGIFNFADLAVMAGCVVLLLAPARGPDGPPASPAARSGP
jgi:signal peptidase II